MTASVEQAQEYRREMTARVEINTERFLLRELTIGDVSSRYLGWLSDYEAKKWISAAVATKKLSDLRQYVLERIGRDDILFLGIFEKTNGLHIGNIKYEPVNSDLGYAIMGMLIGDHAYRSKGVAAEVLSASAGWLKEHRNIRQIVLGVSKDNPAAVKAYEKVGFVAKDTPHIQKPIPGAITMVWCLESHGQ